MQIADKKAVSISYTLKNEAGDVLDSSEGRAPLVYLHGTGSIVPGLERALAGKQAGDEVNVDVEAEDGYGARDEKKIRKVPSRKLPPGKVSVGTRYRVQTDGGAVAALVTAIEGDYVTIDANHPLAGMKLHFDVKVVDVRDATADELEHGHAHGPGGHH